jgi:glycosyltransferase involved in cell wall biosynthesis
LPIVYTGTFEHYQGLDLLFESAGIVRKLYPEVAFVLVGGKPEQIEYWKDEVRKNNLEDCVIFTGAVTPAETLAYLEMAEILVSPRTEGLSVPLKIYTYLYSGKPTVATELIAHTQILNNDNAVLVTPEKKAFAEGILRLVRDPNLRQRIGLQAQEFVKGKSTLTNYLTRLKQIYQPFQPVPTLEQPASFSTELQAPLS